MLFGALPLNDVAVLLVSNVKMLPAPLALPASITYDSAPATAFHVSVTVFPVADAPNPAGAAGAGQGPPPPSTTIVTSFDGPLLPSAFRARTRTR